MEFMLETEPGSPVSITEDGESILTYHYGESVLHPYFHPIYAPNRELITNEVEGTEQKYSSGLSFIFGTVLNVNRNPVELNKISSLIDKTTSNISCLKDAEAFVNSITWESSEVIILQTSKITVYPFQDDVRIIDLSVEMSTNSDILLFENGLGLSYNAVEMEHRKVADSEGRIGESEVNGKEAEWGTLCGITNDTPVGMAILPDSSNGKTIFHSVDTHRGYLSAQYSPLTLKPDEKQSFNFRILVYLGDLFTFDVQKHYSKYMNETH